MMKFKNRSNSSKGKIKNNNNLVAVGSLSKKNIEKKQGVSSTFDLHLSEGKSWEEDVVHHIKWQRNIAYVVSGGLLFLAISLSIAIAFMAPLKTVEPLYIEVEKSTGQVFVKTDLINTIKDIDEKNAVIEAMLARYLIAWKTYEYTDNLERQRFIKAMSSSVVYKEYESIWESDDEEINPKLKYGLYDKAEVEVISIAQLNETTHQARIAIKDKSRSSIKTNYFVVIIKHKLAPVGMTQKDRWTNPIGILVESIRFDEEYLD